MSLRIRVHGTPAPQGSKRAFVNRHTGKASVVEMSKRVTPWREAVKAASLTALGRPLGVWGEPHEPIAGPVVVYVTFLLARPKGHYGTGRNADVLRDSAPKYPAVKPDLDKLIRSTLDALTEARVWTDDSQVVRVTAEKRYDPFPGAFIEVRAVGSRPTDTEGAA